MKKIILSLAAVFAFGAASAQELVSSKGEEYLPKQGDWSIGFNVGNALTYLGQAFNGTTSNDGSNLFRESSNRSEEHTSELQSRQYLVCRLLLEKKK